jgi:hypothetical protein
MYLRDCGKKTASDSCSDDESDGDESDNSGTKKAAFSVPALQADLWRDMYLRRHVQGKVVPFELWYAENSTVIVATVMTENVGNIPKQTGWMQQVPPPGYQHEKKRFTSAVNNAKHIIATTSADSPLRTTEDFKLSLHWMAVCEQAWRGKLQSYSALSPEKQFKHALDLFDCESEEEDKTLFPKGLQSGRLLSGAATLFPKGMQSDMLFGGAAAIDLPRCLDQIVSTISVGPSTRSKSNSGADTKRADILKSAQAQLRHHTEYLHNLLCDGMMDGNGYCFSESIEMINQLLQVGVDPNTRIPGKLRFGYGGEEATLLHYIPLQFLNLLLRSPYGHDQNAKFDRLRDYSASASSDRDPGDGGLGCFLGVMASLLEFGADASLQDQWACSAFDLACRIADDDGSRAKYTRLWLDDRTPCEDRSMLKNDGKEPDTPTAKAAKAAAKVDWDCKWEWLCNKLGGRSACYHCGCRDEDPDDEDVEDFVCEACHVAGAEEEDEDDNKEEDGNNDDEDEDNECD